MRFQRVVISKHAIVGSHDQDILSRGYPAAQVQITGSNGASRCHTFPTDPVGLTSDFDGKYWLPVPIDDLRFGMAE